MARFRSGLCLKAGLTTTGETKVATPSATEICLDYTEVSVAWGGEAPVELQPELIVASLGRWAGWRVSGGRKQHELASLGSDLGRALLPPSLRRFLQSEIRAARLAESPIRLILRGKTETVARVPWEALCLSAESPVDPIDGSLASQPDLAIIRQGGQQPPSLAEASLREARLLIVTSDPNSSRYRRLAWVEAEAQAIQSATARTKSITVRRLVNPTPERLRDTVAEFRPHIFHFSGHAESNLDGANLVLCQGNGTAALSNIAEVGKWLFDAGCQIAVLAACETDGQPDSAASQFWRIGLPAVVAMQFAARDVSLPTFSRALYGALADGAGLDRAMAEARLAIGGPAGSEMLPTLWCGEPFAIAAPQISNRFGALTNLPSGAEAEPTIGRDEFLSELDGLLKSNRIVGLVGPVGVGKSHLARVAASRSVSCRPDGVWFVDCSSLERVEQAWEAIASLVTGGRELSSIAVIEKLRGLHPLIVLDGFEGLAALGGKQMIEEMVRKTESTVLVTSRVVFPGRCQLEIGPLDSGFSGSPADLLFAHLAGLDLPNLGSSERLAITELCTLLDGVPLAVAVAAGRSRITGVVELRDLLVQSPVRALGGVNSAVGVAIERSLSVLPTPDRELLWQLSIFQGSFDWHSVIEVFPGDRFRLLDGIERLVDGSAIRRTMQRGRPRFQVMNPVRDYLAATLGNEAVAPELAEARLRYIDHFSALALSAARNYGEGRWKEGADIVGTEMGNFRAALNFALDRADLETVAALSEALCRPLMEAGMESDFTRFSAAGYQAADLLGNKRLCSSLLGLDGALAGRKGNLSGCQRAWERREKLCGETNDLAGLVDVRLDLAIEARNAGELLRASELLQTALSALEGQDRPDLGATAAVVEATIELAAGRSDQARAAAMRAETIETRASDKDSLLYVRAQLGHFWREMGDYSRAERAYLSVATDALEGHRYSQAAIVALGLSSVLEFQGRVESALRCTTAAEALFRLVGSYRSAKAAERMSALCEKYPSRRPDPKMGAVKDPCQLLSATLEEMRSESRAMLA